jgi:hypothetical protein
LSAKAMVSLGSQANAELLFSYPNDGHETQPLVDTIEHYLFDSLAREGILASAKAGGSSGAYTIEINCQDIAIAGAIESRYQSFFDLGSTGYAALQSFVASGKSDPAWKFLLPLGLPMEFARAVEIMDFPPLSLIKKQDYLNSKTTNRWWELLMINGVPSVDKARYTCIADIVPVAAPANDGKKLDQSGIYNGPFDSYSLPLLELFSRPESGPARRPLIGLGLPIRTWIKRNWSLNLSILDVGTLTVTGTEKCPVIASNHPSFFYYAVTAYTGTPNGDKKNLAAGLAVMKQDIVASAWHAEMGKTHDADPAKVLSGCIAQWANRDAELLALVKNQAGIPQRLAEMKEEGEVLAEMEEEVEDIRQAEPSKEELAELEHKFHAEGPRSE